ncbi:MAG: MerR family transcriptional regulator [Bacteroidia bacterium]|nr:MerR family transcriptional regulator [Bacteroidia bacterium]
MDQSDKLYYSIGEVAARFKVNVSLIRFWTNEFSDHLKPKTNKKGNRYYTADNIRTLERIYHLVKEQEFTLSGAKEKLFKKSENQIDKKSIISKLNELKNYLQELKTDLDKIT